MCRSYRSKRLYVFVARAKKESGPSAGCNRSRSISSDAAASNRLWVDVPHPPWLQAMAGQALAYALMPDPSSACLYAKLAQHTGRNDFP
jgi:hypothetical protein